MHQSDSRRTHPRRAGGERPSRRDRDRGCRRHAGLCAGRRGVADLFALLAQADAGDAAGRIGSGQRSASDEEMALACASHSGEPMHTTRVAAWLARIGLGENDLACGAHPSRYEPVGEAMIKRGEKPTRILNNCSGKHTGFLTVARHWDIATQGYERPRSSGAAGGAPSAARAFGASTSFTWGIDGCAAPNFALTALRVSPRAGCRQLAGTRGSVRDRLGDDRTSRARVRHGTRLRHR